MGQLGDTATITCADVGSLKMPVLLVGGEKSTRDFQNILDATHKCLPSAERVVIPNAGHGMHRQNSAAFDAGVLVQAGALVRIVVFSYTPASHPPPRCPCG